MKFSQKNIENWRFWKMTFFWVGHFEFYFFKKKNFFCFILMKISHKLCIRMDEAQFLRLWWYTAKTQSPQTFQPAVYSSTWKFSINVRCTKFKTSCFLCKCFLGCPKIPGRCLPKITNLDRLGKRHEWVIIVLNCLFFVP